MAISELTQRILNALQSVPEGKVATYGAIARMAGNARAARQVVRTLHTFSRQKNLPWHRIVNSQGKISLAKHNGYERQKELLLKEGILFDKCDTIDLATYLWKPDQNN